MKKKTPNNSDKLPKNARKIDLNNNNNNQETVVIEISKQTTDLDDTLFPPTLEGYVLEDSLGGGTGSVYKIKNINNNNRLVLKYGASQAAMETEILCNTIYKVCGVPVPKSKVYTSLPQDLAAKLGISSSGIFQVSEFLTEDNENETENKAIIKNTAKAHFLVHVLLGNIDVCELENFIVKNKEAFLVDAGGNFIYKPWGELRKENPSFATELKTLKDTYTGRSGWFGGFTEKELREQADEIKKCMPQIVEAILEVSKTLGISDYRRDQFIEYITDRLDRILIPYASELPYAKIDKKAMKGETGAGVLTYRIINNEAQVLLSKRKEDRYWDNFGGKSDENEKLIDTAKRKVYKESQGEINYSEYELKESPSHDFISEGITYRMYIVRNDNVNLGRINNSKHTTHQWVPLRALRDSNVKIEGKTTVEIKTEQGAIRLYPPLYNMMKEKAVSEHLKNLIEKKPCELTHTQSRHNKKDKFNWGYIPQTRELITDQIAKTSLARSKLFFSSLWFSQPKDNFALVKENLSKSKLLEEKTLSPPVNRKLSQSEVHLKAELGDAYQKNDIKKNVETFLDTHYPNLSDNRRELLSKHCEALISEEIHHPELFYAYHGVNNEIAFAYDVYTRLYRMIHMNEKWQALRLDKGQFKAFSTINEFIAYYSKMGTTTVHDSDEEYSDITISANAFLFGSKKNYSNSIYLLLNNITSRDTTLELIFKNFLQPFNVGEYEIKQLMSLFERYASNKGGSLYQIGMNPEEVAKYTYPAGDFGVMNPLGGEKNLTNIMTKLKEEIIKPNVRMETIGYIEHLEVRVMTPPSFPLKMKKIDLEGEKDLEIEKQYEMELNKAVESVLYQMLKNMNSFNKPHQAALFEPFHQEMKNNQQDPDSFAQMPKETLMRAIIHQDTPTIKFILKHFPELLWEKLSIRTDHIENEPVNIFIPQGMKAIEMLIKHLSNFSVILSDIHGKKWFEQIKDDCSFQVIEKVLDSIPDEYRFDFANKHQNKIKGSTLGIEDGLDLSYVLYLLPPGKDCFQFARAHQGKIQNGHALAAVLKILSKKIGTLSENSVYEFALENQDKINNTKELIAVLEELKKVNRYNIATNKKDKIEYPLGIFCVLGMLSEEKQYPFAEENMDRLGTAMQVSFMLAEFSSDTDKYKFAEKNKDKIKNDTDLNYVCNHLPVDRRDDFKKMVQRKETLMRAIIDNDTVEIKLILKQFPELLWEKLSIPNSNVEEEAIEILIKHSSNFGVILSDTHGKNWFEQIKDDCSFQVIEKVLDSIPDEYRFDFANKHQNKIEGSTLGYLASKLPENTRYTFAKLHNHVLKNSHHLQSVLSKLLFKDRYTFAEENSNCIEDGFGLSLVLDLLPPGKDCFQFARAHKDKIQNGNQLARVLEALSKNIETLSENIVSEIASDNQYKTTDIVYEFAFENQDKINNGQELIAVLEKLKKGNRYNIATNKKDKIEYFQGICSVLGMLSEEKQYPFAEENMGKIKTATQVSFMLAKFSSDTDKYKFAEKNKDKIKNDTDLKYVRNRLPVDRRDDFEKMLSLNQNEEVSFKLGF